MAVQTPFSAKMVIVAAVAALVLAAVPVAAQTSTPQPAHPTSRQDQTDPLWIAATTLNQQRDRAFHTQDLAALSALYTQDASYVELLPVLQSMRGQAEIRLHFQELLDAKASDIQTTVGTVIPQGDNAALVTGAYVVTVNNRPVTGSFVQTLRREGGTWKIAEHIFARPEMITESETHEAGSD